MSDEFYNRGNKSQRLIINKISKKVIGEALVNNLDEIIDKVGVQLIGVIPDDFKTTVATGKGTPIPTDSSALKAFDAISKRDVKRILMAFANDPLTTCSFDDAKKLFREMCENTKEYLSGFDLSVLND